MCTLYGRLQVHHVHEVESICQFCQEGTHASLSNLSLQYNLSKQTK